MTPDQPTPPKPIEIRTEETIGLSLKEALGLQKNGPDSEGLVVVEHDWRADSEIEQGTIARATSEGAPSQGEADSLACAGRFVGFRRSQGETWWDDPIRVDVRDRPWVDCEARDRRDAKREPLLMQVQRAMIGDERYAEWADEGRFELPSGTAAQQAAAILMEAIEKKRKKAAAKVVLLLDADRLPWLALRDVVAEFRRLYGEPARQVGFSAIYVVPWHVSAVAQLDTSA